MSGLVNFVPIDAMMGRRVVVLTNLKPAKMRDVVSSGMVRPFYLTAFMRHACMHVCCALPSMRSRKRHACGDGAVGR